MSYQIELLHTLLNEFLYGDSALLTTDGDILAVRGKNPVSYGTLSSAAETVRKYLRLNEGDIVLVNDPYSGGSVLSSYTFVTALSEDLIWVKCLPYKPSWKLANSIEEEGLRIPPTPVRQGGNLNEMILSAISGHPSCPEGFCQWIAEQCSEISTECQKFVRSVEVTGLDVTSELIEEYLDLCKHVAIHKVTESAAGDARVEVYLDSGDMIRLKAEISDGHIRLDFSGTTASKTVNLTESATYGACFHWLGQYYGFTDLANSGTFAVLQVTKPVHCLLESKYPAPTTKGMTDGVAALQLALQMAMNQIHAKKELSPDAHSALKIQLRSPSQAMTWALPGGQGAGNSVEGKAASGLCESLSVELIERNFPVLVQKIDYRTNSGGKGKFNGGRGITLKLQATADIEASWMSDLTIHRPRVSKNCIHGDVAEVHLEKEQQSKKLAPQGTLILKDGDVAIFSSGGGGGWGK